MIWKINFKKIFLLKTILKIRNEVRVKFHNQTSTVTSLKGNYFETLIQRYKHIIRETKQKSKQSILNAELGVSCLY